MHRTSLHHPSASCPCLTADSPQSWEGRQCPHVSLPRGHITPPVSGNDSVSLEHSAHLSVNPSFSSASDPGADCCVWFVHCCFSLRAKVSVIFFTRRLAVTMGALTTLEDGPSDDLLYDHGPNSRPCMENPATLGTAFQLLPAPTSPHPQHLQSYRNIFPSHFIFGSFFPPILSSTSCSPSPRGSAPQPFLLCWIQVRLKTPPAGFPLHPS